MEIGNSADEIFLKKQIYRRNYYAKENERYSAQIFRNSQREGGNSETNGACRTENMSTYIRKIATDGYLLNVDLSCFDKMPEDIHGVSKNNNQIAKRINATNNIYAEDMQELKNNQEKIWELLREIYSQLL